MKTFQTILLITMLLVAYSLTQTTPTCTTQATCNHYNTFDSKRCTGGQCVDYTLDGVYKEVRTSTQMCKDSFRLTTGRCGSIAAPECVIPAAETTWRQCAGGSNRRSSDGKCDPVAIPSPAPVIVKLNEKCNSTSSPKLNCPLDQFCLNNVCRQKLKEREFCRGSGIPCNSGLQCHDGYCTLEYSKNDGERSTIASVCKSSVSLGQYCQNFATNTPCYTNDDCLAHPNGVCKKPSGLKATTDEIGKCESPLLSYIGPAMHCAYYNCYTQPNHGDGDKCTESKCSEITVKMLCASQCLKSVDQRFEKSIGKIFDCKALTFTAMTASDCEVKVQFKNCDATLNY